MNYFRFSEQADNDLEDAFDDMREKSPQAAGRFIDMLERKCDLYAHSPLLAILRDDLADELRCFPVGPYLAFYRPIGDGSGIEIARVLHGAMNITADLFGT